MTLVDNVVAPASARRPWPASTATSGRDPTCDRARRSTPSSASWSGSSCGCRPATRRRGRPGRCTGGPAPAVRRGRDAARARLGRPHRHGRRPAGTLARFPYLGNYRRLVRLEVDALGRTARRRVRRVAFLGSGPLPLSALLLAQRARRAGRRRRPRRRRLSRPAPGGHGARRRPGRVRRGGRGELDLAAYDVVVLAALVGESRDEKQPIAPAPAAAMRAGRRAARPQRPPRPAHALYPPVDGPRLQGFEPLERRSTRSNDVDELGRDRWRPGRC